MTNAAYDLYEAKLAAQEVANADNPLLALQAFQQNLPLLNDWCILYADVNDYAELKLSRASLPHDGVISSVFRGQSLWVLDKRFACNAGRQQYRIGTGSFVDANAASYIRSVAYQEPAAEKARQSCAALAPLLNESVLLNPFLYLWECTRDWTPKTIARCRESVAAIYALSLDAAPLSPDWGARYRKHYREQAEAHAEQLLADFARHRSSFEGEDFAQQADVMEIMLVRTKVIELASSKPAAYKMAELIRFMHEELGGLLMRELIVCADILGHRGQCKLSAKLHSLESRRQPMEKIKNCAWDLFLFRVLDFLSKPDTSVPIDFYIANLISFDADIADILKLTQLRGMALHLPSKASYPVFEQDMLAWLKAQVGNQQWEAMAYVFDRHGFADRQARIGSINLQDLLTAEREHLLHLMQQKSCKPA